MSGISVLVGALVSFMEHQARTPLSILRLEFADLAEAGVPAERLALLNRQIEKLEGVFGGPRSPDIDAKAFWDLVGQDPGNSWVLRDFHDALTGIVGEAHLMSEKGRSLTFESFNSPMVVTGSFRSFTEYFQKVGNLDSHSVLMLDLALLTMGIYLRIECEDKLSVIIRNCEP